jgi:hypothetical protein
VIEESEASKKGGAVCAALLVLLFAVSALPATAGNSSLRASLNTWSTRLGADAHSVVLAAQNRHPRRMTTSANRFRRDALAAQRAIRAQTASTRAGRRAKGLALSAFADYARAGALWAASGRARLAHHVVVAVAAARRAATFARTGNRLLVTAGRLLK